MIAPKLSFALLGAIEILHNRIFCCAKCQTITFSRRSEAAKTEQILEASREHILGEDKSTLPYECGQLVGLDFGEGV